MRTPAGEPAIGRRRIVIALLAVTVTAVVVFIVGLIMAIRTAGQAEHTHHAVLAVARTIAAHAAANDGRLPTSWADLEGIGLQGPSMDAGAPIASVQERVVVDWSFASTIAAWRQRDDRTRSIQAKGPCFRVDSDVEMILSAR